MATDKSAAELLVRCLEAEGVEYVFGIPGEENIYFIDALTDSSIRYILVRHEQAGSFMAEIYGRLTGKAGVTSATLGPGAVNLLLGVADATTNSTPLVALSAQAGLNRLHKESHQAIDLVPMFQPVTKWADTVFTVDALPETVRRAFKTAQSERPGAVYVAVPEDIESAPASPELAPLPVQVSHAQEPSPSQVARAAEILLAARQPVVLAGHGATRAGASQALVQFSDALGLPVATTFNGKGVFPDDHPNALGTVGFMRHDYVNFGFDEADVVVAVGYELQEFDPVKVNPDGDKQIIHIHLFPAETDAHYPVAVEIEADISHSLRALADAVPRRFEHDATETKVCQLLSEELAQGLTDDRFPVTPGKLVASIRQAADRSDIVLADTGSVKMWMARLYPTYEPNTLIVSNGLSSMGFAVPGAIAAKLVHPDRRVIAATGDGAFLMNSQELETAVREQVPITVVVSQDNTYGLIGWKMDLELGRSSHVEFGNPDLVAYAESFGARGYRVTSADELLPTLREALAYDGVAVVTVPVDYSHNIALTDKLGELAGPF